MNIIYREFQGENDIRQCIDLQKSIFGLSDVDTVSPLMLKLIMRNNPPVGVVMGAFTSDDVLTGFIIGSYVFNEKSIYAVVMGVTDDYRKKGVGSTIFLEFKKTCLLKGIQKMYGIYDPLDSKLAYLFFCKLGFTGIHLEKDAFNTNLIETNEKKELVDRILFFWDFDSMVNTNSTGLLQKYPVIEPGFNLHSKKLLYKIPLNIKKLDAENPVQSMKMRVDFRNTFDYLLNQQQYQITGCIKDDAVQPNRFYYVLEK